MPSNITASDWIICHRPTRLDEIYGQDLIVKFYKNCQKTGKWPKASYFLGRFGLGKTTLAKIIAMNLACKKTDEHNEPCGVCPSCQAIINESWDRDVMYANGTKMSANDVRAIIDGFKSTGAFRDKNKVLIIDETQDLSPEALNALLEVMESPRPGQYIIANSMQKLKGSLAGAFESRTKKWKLKEPSLDMIYMYLAKMGLKLGLVTKDVKSTVTGCPDSFWLPENSPIMRIVENSDYSYRKALDLLEQAFEGELFTVEQLDEVLDFGSYDEMISTVEKLVNGTIDNVVLDTVVGSKYQDDFNLIYHILGNAEICRVFGRLSNDDRDAWKARQPLTISKGKYYPEVRDAFRELARLNNGFLRKGDWSMIMAQLVEKIRTPPLGITSTGRRATK